MDNYQTQRAILDDAIAAFGGAAIGLFVLIVGGVVWLLI